MLLGLHTFPILVGGCILPPGLSFSLFLYLWDCHAISYYQKTSWNVTKLYRVTPRIYTANVNSLTLITPTVVLLYHCVVLCMRLYVSVYFQILLTTASPRRSESSRSTSSTTFRLRDRRYWWWRWCAVVCGDDDMGMIDAVGSNRHMHQHAPLHKIIVVIVIIILCGIFVQRRILAFNTQLRLHFNAFGLLWLVTFFDLLLFQVQVV